MNDTEKLKAQLNEANSLLQRLVKEARIEIDDNNDVVDDDIALISDELFVKCGEYCDKYGIDTEVNEDDNSDEDNQGETAH